MKTIRLDYYIDTVIPSDRANTVHVMKMCRALQAAGAEVTLHCNTDDRSAAAHQSAIWEKYGVDECFTIRQTYVPRLLRTKLHRIGILYGAFCKACSGSRDAIAYGRSPYALYFLRKRRPFLYEAHAEPGDKTRKLEEKLLRSKNCIGLVVISDALKKRYLELFPFLKPERITVLHDGADEAQPCEPAVLRGDSGGVKIGYLGSLYPGKCMETLIPLAAACPQWTFHVVGGAPQWLSHWKSEAQAAGAANLVFYGQVDNAAVGAYYEAFDICLMPFSKNVFVDQNKRLNIGSWISPLKLFEAMARGKAILVARLPSIEEVVSDGEQCVFAEPDNVSDWAEKLKTLVSDGALRARLGAAAKQTLEARYTWEIRAKALLEKLRESDRERNATQ